MRVFLFDIDGTLVKTGGAGSRALSRAFQQRYGVTGAMDTIRPHGRTDLAICREAYATAIGKTDVPREELDELFDDYVPLLEDEVATAETYEVLPGVLPLLEHLAGRGDLLGLATGNIERAARIKIARGGLDRYFSFGGFGDDGEDRADIVRRASERAGRRQPNARSRPWVIGDTERDVAAAIEAGCHALAVASGWVPVADLHKAGADIVYPSLEGVIGLPPFA